MIRHTSWLMLSMLLAGSCLAMEGSVSAERPKHNHLIGESSPYLQQHAHNPVDWYPWSEEAFALARMQDRPIFLSIGYSTCHWCHVMEKESFADAEVAEALNDTFIAIKVDREERPDIDAIYMQAAQTMNGSGGWPLNVIMTPDRQPFYAATYLPKHSRFGHIGIIELAGRISELWRHDRQRIERSAASLTAAVQRGVALHAPGDVDSKAVGKACRQLAGSFDRVRGGLGEAPKFPSPHRLLFLLRYGALEQQPDATAMAVETLRAMQRGGIHDQLGGGFHRYSTDAEWLLPHFEKMLYDQAMLLIAYSEAWQVTHDATLADTARGIATYLLRDMQHEQGGFYAAEDADSEGVEGKFYVWSEAEVRRLLGRDADAFIRAYGIEKDGNFIDEAKGRKTGDNILHLGDSTDAGRFAAERARLLEARSKRARPFRDDKILSDWNGLAIAALAIGGRILNDPAMIEAAGKAATFVLTHLQDDGVLLHSWRDGRAGIDGHLNDYAAMIWGLTELYESDFDPDWLEHAQRLNRAMIERFRAPGGSFYMTAAGNNLIARPVESFDGALPSGNALAMHNLLRLSRLTGDAGLEEQAAAVARHFSGMIGQAPSAMTHMLSAVLLATHPGREIVLAGPRRDATATNMLALIRQRFRPDVVVLWRDGYSDTALNRLAPFSRGQRAIAGRATAYVCEGHSCNLPVTDTAALARLIGGD